MEHTDLIMSNDHITAELDRFRCARGRAFYALQIDAPWGAGKTHFVRSYLKRTCAPTKAPGHIAPEPRHILISLFGATSVEDLERQAVAQLFSEGERLLGSVASSVMSEAATRYLLGRGLSAILNRQRSRLLSDRLARLRDLGGLVVFDDVERTRIPLRDALGYINRFIEHEGFKVVLVTNEAALGREDASEDDQANLKDLRSFKEKLVGRTLAFSPTPDRAYDAFVASMAGKDARRLAVQGRDGAVALFRASDRKNLRSVRMGLEAFDRLVRAFEPAWLEQPEAMREVLLGCLFVAIEHAAGAVAEAVANPIQGRIRGLLGLDRDEVDRAQADAHRIFAAYEDHLRLTGPPIPFPTLLALVAEGRLLEDEVRKGMTQSPLVVGNQNAPPWRVLIEVWDLDIEGSQRAVERARQQFAELTVTDPGELLHLAGIMLWRAHHDDLSLSDGQPVAEFIQGYLGRLQKKGIALRPNLRPFNREPHLSAYGYVVTSADEGREDLHALAGMIRDAVLGGVRDRFPELRERLLAELAKPDRDLSTIGTEGDLKLALDLPVFEGWGTRPFADLLMRDGRFDLAAMKWLAEGRYGERQRLEPLVAEAAWFESLCDTLRLRIAAAPPPFRSSWRGALNDLADPALARFRRHQASTETAELI